MCIHCPPHTPLVNSRASRVCVHQTSRHSKMRACIDAAHLEIVVVTISADQGVIPFPACLWRVVDVSSGGMLVSRR